MCSFAACWDSSACQPCRNLGPPDNPCTSPPSSRQAKQQQFELQYASVAAELEEARRLNAELRAAVAAREAVKENWEAVEPLLRATASPQRPRQRCRCDDTASVAAGWQLHPFQKRVALYTQVCCRPSCLFACAAQQPAILLPSLWRN